MAAYRNIENLLNQLIPIWGLERIAEIIKSDTKLLKKGQKYDDDKYWKALKDYHKRSNLELLDRGHKSLSKALNLWVPHKPKEYGDSLSGLLEKSVTIWGHDHTARCMNVQRETVTRWLNSSALESAEISEDKKRKYRKSLESLLPKKPRKSKKHSFDFIDLFAGIGGLRTSFERIDGKCVFTSEWDEYAQRTYLANYYDEHAIHTNIAFVTEGGYLAQERGIPAHELSDSQIENDIKRRVPDHDVLLAGFPCQPFSIAGVSKKNSMGKAHGFNCKLQGNLFFDVCKILKAKKPACVMLENVDNLQSHNGGDTYRTILEALEDAGYEVSEPRVINAKEFLPQSRKRIIIVGFRKGLPIGEQFNLENVKPIKRKVVSRLGDLLDEKDQIDRKYTLTENLWTYLRDYKKKHRAKGNGYGYDLFIPESEYTRTLSARYNKDGSEILIARNKTHARQCEKGACIPRRLTPSECARLMGFDAPGESNFEIPVSDTRAYNQFGNSVVVPLFEAVARELKPHILQAVTYKNATIKSEKNAVK